jgi:hypothetical protein
MKITPTPEFRANPNDYVSNWEYCRTRSRYHFDPTHQDKHGEWFQVFGRFASTWQEELATVKSRTRGMNFENRKWTMGRNGPASPMLAQEEYDIQRGGGDPKVILADITDDFTDLPELKKVVDFFGLERVMSRVLVQRTGQTFVLHLDKIDDLYPGVPFDQLVRIHVMLEDWQPGQFYQYGNYTYQNWQAGDAHYFDWPSVPHSTANASNQERVTLQVTGIITDRTRHILENPEFQQLQI